MKHILLIDDDPTIHTIVRHSIKNEFNMMSCYSIEEANTAIDNKENFFSIILIDRILPDGDGLSICHKVRSEERLNAVPIIFLSGKDTENDKVSGLFAGADDYIVKPFSVLEFVARIKARFRMSTKRIHIEKLILDLNQYKAYIKDFEQNTEIDLTKTEFKILMLLVESPKTLLKRDFLVEKIWGANHHISPRVIDTHISHLRKKLANTNLVLESLRGIGYKLSPAKKTKDQAAA